MTPSSITSNINNALRLYYINNFQTSLSLHMKCSVFPLVTDGYNICGPLVAVRRHYNVYSEPDSLTCFVSARASL